MSVKTDNAVSQQLSTLIHAVVEEQFQAKDVTGNLEQLKVSLTELTLIVKQLDQRLSHERASLQQGIDDESTRLKKHTVSEVANPEPCAPKRLGEVVEVSQADVLGGPGPPTVSKVQVLHSPRHELQPD